MFSLENQVALITGAASGIGAATAMIFAEAGANLVLAHYSPDGHDIEPVRRAIEEKGRRVLTADVDVTQEHDMKSLIDMSVEKLGSIDIVLANAGIARRVDLDDLDDKAWNETIGVDLIGVWHTFHAAIPHMKRAGYGRFLATSSTAGVISAWPQHAQYAAAKGGLVGLVKSLGVELAPFGITTNCVAPGVVRTPQTLDSVNSLGANGLDTVHSQIPVGRVGIPEDIAYLFLYLASREAGYISGQTIVADGARGLATLDS